jgi:RND superfamily putative drug exporter
VLSVLTFLLLTVVFRSVLLAAKAVVFNLASLGAAYGILTLLWQRGLGSQALFGVSRTGAITVWVPLIIFAFLFGLSMDYEVFLLSRIREEYGRLGCTDAAIVEGLARTGKLITGAALILFLAFLSLATAPATEVKMVGTALGAGILLDATIVRALLVPTVVSLLGRAAWWVPGRRAVAVRVPG